MQSYTILFFIFPFCSSEFFPQIPQLPPIPPVSIPNFLTLPPMTKAPDAKDDPKTMMMGCSAAVTPVPMSGCCGGCPPPAPSCGCMCGRGKRKKRAVSSRDAGRKREVNCNSDELRMILEKAMNFTSKSLGLHEISFDFDHIPIDKFVFLCQKITSTNHLKNGMDFITDASKVCEIIDESTFCIVAQHS